MSIVITQICSPLHSVVLEMFVRMVVLLLFHLGSAEFVDDENFDCNFKENCLKFCCVLEIGDDYCQRLEEKLNFFTNATLSADKIKCQKVRLINDELNYEVNDPN